MLKSSITTEGGCDGATGNTPRRTPEGRTSGAGHERSRTGAQARRAYKPHHRYPERATCDHWRHCPSTRAFFRDEPGVLAQPSKPVRTAAGAAESREDD